MAAPTSAAGIRLRPAGSVDLRNEDAEKGLGTPSKAPHKPKAPHGDVLNMALLVVLYAMQGVPLGLTMGSMPFLLQARASYTALGAFSVASYPYSLKLLWSPVVDSLYSLRFGRRKSWVVPIQLASAALMLGSASWVEARLAAAEVAPITALFSILVLLAATQDVAVDGWALTLLSRAHVGYASTCQTVGMNLGYFASFTVFLALNDPAFCNAYLRKQPQPQGVLPLGTYMRGWGWAYIVVTLVVAFCKRERNFVNGEGSDWEEGDPWQGSGPKSRGPEGRGQEGHVADISAGRGGAPLREGYAQLWGVVRLPAVRRFALLLVAFRLGVLPAEQAAPLKLLEKGVSKEALAGLVLLEFPCELVSAVLAGRWAASASPFRPWLAGYRLRLVMAAVVTLLVRHFPSNAASLAGHPGWFGALAAAGLATSFTSTLMFTALGSFFNRISDPAMGGAYLTLLNTIANMGVILPKVAMFAAMDWLTVRKCVPRGAGGGARPALPNAAARLAALACTGAQATSGNGDGPCAEAGGECVVVRDGYYLLSFGCITAGAALYAWLRRAAPELEALPLERWRAARPSLKGAGGREARAPRANGAAPHLGRVRTRPHRA